MSRVPLAEPVPGFPGAFWARVALDEADDPGFLTADERALFETLGTPKRRREWLGGRLAARAVARAIGAGACSVLRTDEGAPVLRGPGGDRAELAITHGRAHAAAIGAHRSSAHPFVGIDWVDAADAVRIRRVAGRVLTPTEQALCADRDLALLVAWGSREAVAKATRTGMFVFALGRVHLTALDLAAGRAEVGLPGVAVRFEPAPDGGAVVVAGVTAEARAHAGRIAHGPG